MFEVREIKKLIPRVEHYLMRTTVTGRTTITIWYGQSADTIFVTPENEGVIKELMDYVDKRNKL